MGTIYDLDSYVQEFLLDPHGEIIQKNFFRKTLFQAKKIHIPICNGPLQMDPKGRAKNTQTIHGKTAPSLGLEI
jgi:hypothetical protein